MLAVGKYRNGTYVVATLSREWKLFTSLKKLIGAFLAVCAIAIFTAYLIAANSPYEFEPDSFAMCMIKSNGIVECVRRQLNPTSEPVPNSQDNAWKKRAREVG
jgi:hypothetical protein